MHGGRFGTDARQVRYRIAFGLLALWLGTLMLFVLPVTSWAALSWSAPVQIEPDDGLAYPWYFSRVACPTATQCTTVGLTGEEATFDPNSPATTPLSTLVTPEFAGGLACPTATQCTAVNGKTAVTFDPQAPGIPTPVTIDPYALRDVSCPTPQQCTAVDADGRAVTFNPSAPASPTFFTLAAAKTAITAVTCPAANQCTALFGDAELTFDPTHGKAIAGATVSTGLATNAIACPSTTQCTVVGGIAYQQGNEITFNPRSSAPPGSPTAIDPVQALSDVSCSSTTQCTALGSAVFTFNPAAPNSGLSQRANGLPQEAEALACPTANQCTFVGATTTTLDPTSTTSPVVTRRIAEPGAFTALSCPSDGQCTALDRARNAVTFDPAQPGRTLLTRAAAGQPDFNLGALACPSVTQCTVIESTFSGNPSNPTATSDEVTFDPQAQSTATPVQIDDQALSTMACPASTQCIAVDGLGREITFNPNSPANLTPVSIGPSMLSPTIVCPATTQCTVVSMASGQEITFDPTDPGTPTPVTIDTAKYIPGQVCLMGLCTNYAALVALACPSMTQCTAVDFDGRELTFDPANPGTPALMPIDGFGLACPTTTQCVTNKTDGLVHEGDPIAGAFWPGQTILGLNGPGPVACSSAHQCVAADQDGHVIVGTGTIGANPATPLPKTLVTDPQVHGTTSTATLSCFTSLSSSCAVTLELSAVETLKRGRLIAVSAVRKRKPHTTHRTVALGSQRTIVGGDQQVTGQVALNPTGRKLLAMRHVLTIKLTVSQAGSPPFTASLRFTARARKTPTRR